jgi:hypothetical protein
MKYIKMKNVKFFLVFLLSGLIACSSTQHSETYDDGLVVATKDQKFDYITWKIQGAKI